MRNRSMSAVGMLCAGAGAVFWAIGLTVLQPLTEPAKPWHGVLVGNNTYWARDLRWMAVVVVLVGLILFWAGDRVRSGWGVVAALGWGGVDILLDRADVTALGATAVAACLVVLAAGVLGRLGPVRPDRRVLIVAASVAAALVPMAGNVASPTDTEAELTPSALAMGAVLVIAALGCAMAAAPAVTAGRWWAAVGIGVTAGAWLVMVRASQPDVPSPLPAVLGAVMLIGVAFLSWDRPAGQRGWMVFLSMAGATLLGYPLMVLVTAVVMIVLPVAAPFTALAGNPPVNAADSDLLITFVGLIVGLIVGAMLRYGVGAGQRREPEPAPVRAAV